MMSDDVCATYSGYSISMGGSRGGEYNAQFACVPFLLQLIMLMDF